MGVGAGVLDGVGLGAGSGIEVKTSGMVYLGVYSGGVDVQIGGFSTGIGFGVDLGGCDTLPIITSGSVFDVVFDFVSNFD